MFVKNYIQCNILYRRVVSYNIDTAAGSGETFSTATRGAYFNVPFLHNFTWFANQ